MKYFTAILYSRDGTEIDRCSDCEGMKVAKNRARYMLSDAFAQQCETTHATWQTMKACIFADGAHTGSGHVCEWDEFHSQHAEFEREERRRWEEREAREEEAEDIAAGNLASDEDGRHLGDENEHANHS